MGVLSVVRGCLKCVWWVSAGIKRVSGKFLLGVWRVWSVTTFLTPKIFWTYNLFGRGILYYQIHWAQNFFRDLKFLWNQNLFGLQIFVDLKSLWTKIFYLYDLKFFFLPNLFKPIISLRQKKISWTKDNLDKKHFFLHPKFSWPIFFHQKIFIGPKELFYQHFFGSQFFMYKHSFGLKHFSDQNIFFGQT